MKGDTALQTQIISLKAIVLPYHQYLTTKKKKKKQQTKVRECTHCFVLPRYATTVYKK